MSDDPAKEREDSLTRLRSLIDSIEGSKVTLIGDTMLDRYHHGFANNLNSTSPVPVLKVTRSEESAGASAPGKYTNYTSARNTSHPYIKRKRNENVY